MLIVHLNDVEDAKNMSCKHHGDRTKGDEEGK